MTDRLRSRWGLPGGLQVIRQRRHRRYRFRPWPTQAELQEESQYSRPMPMYHLDDPVAYRNFNQMPPELCQELEQRIIPEFQRDRTLMRDPVNPEVKLAVTLTHLATGDSYTTIVLLAMVDGDYKFLWVDMGAARSNSDAQIFNHTNLRHKIGDSSIGFPDSESLGIGGPKVNFFIFRDDAFPLKLCSG